MPFNEGPPNPYDKVFLDEVIIVPESEPELRQMFADLRMIEKLADTFLKLAAHNDYETIARLAKARSQSEETQLTKIRVLRSMNHDRVVGLLNQVRQKNHAIARKFDRLPAKVTEAQRIVIAALEQPAHTDENKHAYRPIIADLFDWIRFGFNRLKPPPKSSAIIKKE